MEASSYESRVNVLVVDDNELMREVLTSLLSKRGHQCESASNGKEALKKAVQRRFDVVVTDLEMPEMDGLTLIGELNRCDFKIPVMVMTGRPEEDYRDRAMRSGASDYLRKPFDLSEFMTRFCNLLLAHRS